MSQAAPIFPDTALANGSPVGEPCFYFHQGTGAYLATYLDQNVPGFGGAIVLRSSYSPQGPWSSKQTILMGAAFGLDLYGGFIHPWSNKAPQSANDLYLTVSLFNPYNTYMLKATVS